MSGQWTAVQDAALRDVFPAGAPMEEIAARVCGLGPWRSVAAVRSRADALGLKRPPRVAAPPVPPAPPRAAGEPAWTPAQDALLLSGYAEGLTFSALAEAQRAAGRAGTNRNACIGRVHRLKGRKDLPRRRAARTAAEKTMPRKASNSPARIRAEVVQPVAAGPARLAPSPPLPALVSMPPPALLPPAPTGGVAFLDAGADACRYPLRGEGIGMVICGGGREAGHAYCPAHMRVAYRRPDSRPVRPPASDMQRARPAPAERETDLVDLLACGEAA
ncbi:GcrA family cell cycle regulator [Xanthobacter autotrophicus]|uniref:GcrA family cell cycle regulator n=1 Tax=Xanthobacter autotrophicus TaxID=280 RepID=UPI00372A5D1F